MAWCGEEIRIRRKDGANMAGDAPGKTRSMLAWRGEEIRLRREDGANTAAGYTGKQGGCWRGAAKK